MLTYYHLTHQLNGMYLVTGVEIETVTALQGTESLFLDGFAGSSSRAVLGQPLGVLWGGKNLQQIQMVL
jgi:hypothetical protein